LLRRKRLVCRAEKCREKFDGGTGELEDGKSRQFDLGDFESSEFFGAGAYLKHFKGMTVDYSGTKNEETFVRTRIETNGFFFGLPVLSKLSGFCFFRQ